MANAGDPSAELELARDALADARILHAGDGTRAGVVNRLYYAAFHAAQAALYANGTVPTSHGHVRQAFGQELVLNDDATRADGRLLGELYDYRQQADYGVGDPPIDPAELLDDVDGFVSRMANFVLGRTE
ncbi:HEPN domain-containing protein [Halovivax asiaticus JCM 14624]|uniref:HEPN domain-containing protein n=1 Tax=Halovivax asiaticus JCM 14624 TaxID=1227490 RepID=M0BQU2_9EURY|nr:HEPN domain-containing protein [Halovivax asiaticus]ELZ12019.1 HEPN domain-containing protein [Halovivax asiaticus JCM 14624]